MMAMSWEYWDHSTPSFLLPRHTQSTETLAEPCQNHSRQHSGNHCQQIYVETDDQTHVSHGVSQVTGTDSGSEVLQGLPHSPALIREIGSPGDRRLTHGISKRNVRAERKSNPVSETFPL